MHRMNRIVSVFLIAATLAFGGCDLFNSDGGGGGDNGSGDSGDGTASTALYVHVAYT